MGLNIKLEGIYAVLDYTFYKKSDIFLVASELLDAGIKIFQYRNKEQSKSKIKTVSERILELVKSRHGILIINDFPEIAYDIDADGYHLGLEGLEYISKRPSEKLIRGCSVFTSSDAVAAEKAGCSYLGAGSVFPTNSKKEARIIGLNALSEIVRAVSIPVFGIGGILSANLDSVLSTGAAGAACISALYLNNDVRKSVRNLNSIFDQHLKKANISNEGLI